MGGGAHEIHATLAEERLLAVLWELWRGGTRTMEQLAAAAGMATGAVHSVLHVLARRGCLVEVTPHGVELVQAGLACWRDILEYSSAAAGRRVGQTAWVFRETSSTNDICLRMLPPGVADGWVVLADTQKAGRGRRGGRWEARPGQSVLMSVLLTSVVAEVERLTLLLGLACAEAIEKVIGRPAAIKWPNDVLVGQKKLAGVLVETQPARRRRDREGVASSLEVVLGIGVNVAQRAEDFPPELRGRATSCYQVTGRHMDRLRLVEAILEAIERRCLPELGRASASAAGERETVRESWLAAWKARCPLLGTTVSIRSAGETYRGQVLDIDPLRGLVLRDGHGATHFLSARTSTLSAAPELA